MECQEDGTLVPHMYNRFASCSTNVPCLKSLDHGPIDVKPLALVSINSPSRLPDSHSPLKEDDSAMVNVPDPLYLSFSQNPQ